MRPYPLPQPCPEEGALRAAIAERLGEDPFLSSAPLAIEVAVEPSERGWVGNITFTREGQHGGERRVETMERDCEALTGALALAITVVLDPLPVPLPVPLPDEPEPTEIQAPPVLPTAVPLGPNVAPVTRGALSFRGLVGVGLAVGSGPRPGPSLSAAVGLRYEWTSIDAEGRLDLPTETNGERRVSALLGAASLSPCAHIGPFAGCVLATVGGVRGEGIGVDVPRTAISLFAAVGARSSFEPIVYRPLHLRVTADIQAVVSRPELMLNGEPAWTMPGVIGMFGVAALVEGS